MKTYCGYRRVQAANDGSPTNSICLVSVCVNGRTRALKPRLDIHMHADAFEWGYGGSGPAQLALALVAECAGRKFAVPRVYRRIKKRLVAKFPRDGWTLTEERLRDEIADAIAESGLAHPEEPA
jgi:hypothetical protein